MFFDAFFICAKISKKRKRFSLALPSHLSTKLKEDGKTHIFSDLPDPSAKLRSKRSPARRSLLSRKAWIDACWVEGCGRGSKGF